MRLKALILVPAAAAALALAGCSSDDSSDDAAASDTATTAVDSTAGADTCPTTAPAPGTQADWTIEGQSGSLEVVAPTADAAPLITVQAPFSVGETVVQTLVPGTGEEVSETTTVNVCYEGVNGRDGKVFDSAFQTGRPVPFSAVQVVPGFGQALVGQKVGASVAVAMTPDDGYGPTGQPAAGIEGGDTLIFALRILSVA